MQKQDSEILFEVSKKTERRHNAAITSKKSFQVVSDTGQRLKEKSLIYDTIAKYQPVTSRRLVELTGKERTNITRSLYDLVNEVQPAIKEAFVARCPVTKRKVIHYALTNWKPAAQIKLDLIE